MIIKVLYTYPIKSMGGISSTFVHLNKRGFEYDRRWMLVDFSGKFVSQREYSQLALFELSILKDSLSVLNKASGNSTNVPFIPIGNVMNVRIWDDEVEALEVSEEISNWFSNELGFGVRLVYMPDETERLVDTKYASNSDIVSFADGYPVLVTNTASLNDLNLRLEQPITMNHFRPNIVVEGNSPFEEDDWNSISVGTITISLVKNSARCIMVNIDPQTGLPKTNVLRTLSEYRKKDNKVYFGVNALIKKFGELHVGDSVIAH